MRGTAAATRTPPSTRRTGRSPAAFLSDCSRSRRPTSLPTRAATLRGSSIDRPIRDVSGGGSVPRTIQLRHNSATTLSFDNALAMFRARGQLLTLARPAAAARPPLSLACPRKAASPPSGLRPCAGGDRAGTTCAIPSMIVARRLGDRSRLANRRSSREHAAHHDQVLGGEDEAVHAPAPGKWYFTKSDRI